jgi:hypothetical protein
MTSEEPIAVSDENGNYSFKVDRYSTGTLHAYSDGHEFNAISFTNLPDDATDKNFVEGGSNVEVDYQLDYITVVPPLKTNYKVGETFDNTGLTVYACYTNGTQSAVTDYEMSPVDLSSSGSKSITVTYNGKTAQFSLTVGMNVYSIVYVVDNERYITINDVEPGTPLTPIAEPTKMGYTFSGWSVMPEVMPDNDILVIGTFTKDGDPTSAEQFAAEQLKIWAAGRTIVVENANDEIRVYDAMGRLIFRDAARNLFATIIVNNPGVYIVRVGGEAQRVFVQ